MPRYKQSRAKGDTLPLFFRYVRLTEEEWKDRAACVGADPSLFFSDPEGLERGPQKKVGISLYCAECKVVDECLDYAIRNKEVWGVWGGIDFGSARQRKRILRQKGEE